MIKGFMQVDLTNPLAVQYMEHALKSFEIVSDIFQVEVIQCITPDTYLPELEDIPNKDVRSPQELASLHSNYRMVKNIITAKERYWILEHDAYLKPEHEDVFRMIMSKWWTMPTACLGMSNEFYTVKPEVAKIYCSLVEKGTRRNALGVLHLATDMWVKKSKHRANTIYWPCNRSRDDRWVGKTGVGSSCNQAYNDPSTILYSPITQLIDPNKGATVTDRVGKFKTKVGIDLSVHQPAMHLVDLSE